MQHQTLRGPLSGRNLRQSATRTLRASLLRRFAILLLAAAPMTALATDKPVALDIAASDLATALNTLALDTGAIIYFDASLTEGKRTAGLRGEYPVDTALSELLQDAGLQAEQETDGSYHVVQAEVEEEPEMLPPLTVEGEAQSAEPWLSGDAEKAYRVEDANVGVLGNKILKDTPYSIESYSKALIENKQARSLADITKGDASVNLLMPDNLTTQNQTLLIRGLKADGLTGHRIDGLVSRFHGTDLSVEHLERVEILKGASGFLYGFGQPGGIINYVLKRPTDQPLRSLSTQVMDSGLALAHGDVGGRLGPDDRFGYRVNLVHESGDTYVKGVESRRNSGFIALDWEITPDLLWRFDALLQKHMRKGGYDSLFSNTDGGINYTGGKPPAPIDGSRRLAPSWSHFRSTHETYGTDLSWDFAADWTVTLAHRYSDSGRELNVPLILSDSGGNYSLSLASGNSNPFKSTQSQALINGVFTTGPISHELAVGASYTKFRMETIQERQGIPRNIAVPNVGNLSNPVEVNNPFYQYDNYSPYWYRALDPKQYFIERQREFFVSDTLRLGEDWDIILGLRHGNLDSRLQLPGFFRGYDKSAITPTLAAIFRPMDGLSLYGSYVEALEKGATAPDTAVNANEVFPPTLSRQYEFGAKAETDDWSATAALFRMERALTYTTPANVFTQDGEARYQGLELNGRFRLGSQWLLTASAIFLDATNQKTTGGALDGKRLQGVAREQVSLYGEYRVPSLPLTLTAGARYVGKRPVDSNNRWYVGDVTLLDIGARYETKVAGKGLILRLNVDNVADEDYWIMWPVYGQLNQGIPRTFKLGLELEF